MGAHGELRLALAGHQKSVMGPQYAGAATGAPCPQRRPASAQWWVPSKNCSSSVEPLSAAVEAIRSMVVVTASK